jgi:hypothetical protein
MAHNFKTQRFRGTLYELFGICSKLGPDKDATRAADDWVLEQLHHESALLPIRKHSGFPQRGNRCRIGSIEYIAVDNEPLAYLFESLSGRLGTNPLKFTFFDLLTRKIMPASWNCDWPDAKSEFRFCGVTTEFRKHGLKLAHIEDAGKNDLGWEKRYLRSMLPSNVFLFPSKRVVVWSASGPGVEQIRNKDWCEDVFVRRLALGWMADRLGAEYLEKRRITLSHDLSSIDNWEKTSRGIIVETRPMVEQNASVQVELSPLHSMNTPNIGFNAGGALPKRPKKSAVDLDTSIAELRSWREKFRHIGQVNGRAGNDPSRWYHISIGGYRDGADDYYAEETDAQFFGSDYNGIVNFHGDAKSAAIDRMIDLCDSAEDFHDILVPSATTPRNGAQRPKFALKGYEDAVEGFFLYHDDWQR